MRFPSIVCSLSGGVSAFVGTSPNGRPTERSLQVPGPQPRLIMSSITVGRVVPIMVADVVDVSHAWPTCLLVIPNRKVLFALMVGVVVHAWSSSAAKFQGWRLRGRSSVPCCDPPPPVAPVVRAHVGPLQNGTTMKRGQQTQEMSPNECTNGLLHMVVHLTHVV